jgi:predicted ribosome quality control (RQC) complex YloA/Tae2 family protein
MPLVLDSVLVAALARELEARLAGARLRALRLDRARKALALLFREGTLHFGLDAAAGTIAWRDPLEPDPDDRPLAARLRAARALPDDRVLVLSFTRVRGSPPGVDVIVEWISNRWNAVVTEGPERIVRHLLFERLPGPHPAARTRAARSGHPWTAPEPSARAGVDGALDLARWRELLDREEPARRQRALLASVAWTSPINAAALLGEAARADGAAAERALDEGHRLWLELARIALGAADARPALWQTERGAQPYPLALVPAAEAARSLLDALGKAAELEPLAPPTIPAALLDAVGERAVRAWARADSLRRELAEAPDPDALRGLGDLLLARLPDVPRGVERARLSGFDGASLEVPLDPKRSPQENAADFYERAGRAERARARLPGLIDEAEADARRLDALLERARAGEAAEDVLRAELPAAQEAERGAALPSLPYRIYRSSGGLEIRVGRGASHNDDLTFHHSAPDDVWMHARHAAGAHVVLRWQGEDNPPARDLAEAASLAALHSKARTSGSVPVDWTRRKYVRKPRRSPPGQVLVERARTLFVAPDPELEERLRA